MILRLAAGAWAALFFVAWVAVPTLALAWRGMGAPWGDPVILRVARVTAEQALASTALSVALGLPLGLALGAALARRARLSGAAARLLAIPYGVPTLIASIAAIRWLGRSGWLAGLDWAYSMKAVIAVHVAYNAPWIALRVARARAEVPVPELEAAATLGAGVRARFASIVWPRLRFALASAASQSFGLCVMSFALVLLLGGGPPVETLETAIYSRIRFGSLDLPGAMAAAGWELLLCLLPWALVLGFEARRRSELPAGLPRRAGRAALPELALAALFVSFFFLPFAEGLPDAVRRLADPEFRETLAGPLKISVELAALASLLCGGTALAAYLAGPRVRGAFELALSLPAGISVLVLGLGAWLAYGRLIDPFEGSLAAIACLQAAVFLPLAMRTLAPVARGAQARLLEAAATLGASPRQAFLTVEWPRWRRPVLDVFALAAAASLGELAAVSLFYSENLVPLPLQISRFMSQYRFDDARAAATLLLALAAGAILSLREER